MKTKHVIYVLILLAIALFRHFGYPSFFGVPSEDEYVPKFIADKYTYGDMWYYLCSRALEATAIFFLYLETNSPFILFISCVAGFKIFDEQSTPFDFSVNDIWGWGLSIVITLVWTFKKKLQFGTK